MVVAQINFSCTWGSTGRICDSVSKLLSEQQIENYIFYIYGNKFNGIFYSYYNLRSFNFCY